MRRNNHICMREHIRTYEFPPQMDDYFKFKQEKISRNGVPLAVGSQKSFKGCPTPNRTVGIESEF